MRPRTQEQWSAKAHLEEADAFDWRDVDVPVQARKKYPHANHGKVWQRARFLWPWCPKWFVEFSRTQVKRRAAYILELRRFMEMGAASTLQGELTEEGAAQLELAQRMWIGLQEDKRKEDESNG